MNQIYKKRIVFFFIVLVIVIFLHYIGIGHYLTLDVIKQESQSLKQALELNYLRGVLIFMAIYMSTVIIALPVVPPLTIVSGYLFGVLQGTFYSIISATLGSFISFILIRYFFGSYIRTHYTSRLKRFQKNIGAHGSRYLLMLHLLGIVPYVIINSFAAVTSINLWTFTWTTVLGCIPIFFVFALAGEQLSSIQSMRDIFSPWIIITFMVLIFLTLLPTVIRRHGNSADI